MTHPTETHINVIRIAIRNAHNVDITDAMAFEMAQAMLGRGYDPTIVMFLDRAGIDALLDDLGLCDQRAMAAARITGTAIGLAIRAAIWAAPAAIAVMLLA